MLINLKMNELKVHQTRQNRNLIGMFNYQKLRIKQLGWASRDGKHINVSLDGKITHKQVMYEK